jgi:hypothetical protein
MKHLILFSLVLLFSCNKEKTSGDDLDTAVDIFVEDANGNNLLVDGTPNAINFDAVKLIYLVDGDATEVYDERLDCPKFICHETSDKGSERVRIFPNTAEGEEFPITFINWGNGDMDTLKCHFVRSESSVVCDKVWLNDVPMFPENAIVEFGRAFRIIK